MSRRRRIGLGLASLLIATMVWLPCLQLLYGRTPASLPLLARQRSLWWNPTLRAHEIAKMRSSNAEWDFMGRSFLVWSLANEALRDPAQKRESLAVIDQILDETLRLERKHGMYFFLMPYAKDKPFVDAPARSQFVDGELALMLALRCLVEDHAAYRAELKLRVALIDARMRRSPTLSAESYPDECWTFCNTVALAALKVADHLDGSDHRALLRDWVATAKQKLTDPATGLLVSSYTRDGQILDGPEGSSIWMSVHCLSLIDEPFARDQYARAKQALAAGVLGFGYAREWPRSWQGPRDVDSGPVIPLLDASPGSSGLAFVGAATFDDRDYLRALHATLELAGFPIDDATGRRYAASNAVGDAVLLYSLTLGPAWQKVAR